MTTDPIPRNGAEFESRPVITYEEYRILCDEMQPGVYRKTGVSSFEDYEVAQTDLRTVHVEIDGHRVPLLVPLEHAGGYNLKGTQDLTERQNVYALALPYEFIEDRAIDLNAHLEALGDDSAIIIQTASQESQAIKQKIEEVLTDIDGWKIHEFVDPRIRDESKQTADVAIYYAHFKAIDQNGEPIPRNNLSIRELYEEDVRENGQTETELVEAEQLKDDGELFQQLWDLQDDKFDWLGKYHPVSMQENRDYFKQLLCDDRTKSFVRYANNEAGERKAVAHGIMLEGISLAEWISEHFMQDVVDTAQTNDNARVMFYYGIVSKESEDKDVKYAEDVMGLAARLLNRGGGNTLIVFESTNMSSQYIPHLVREYVVAEPRAFRQQGEAECRSRLDYWSLVSKSKEIV